MLSVVKAPIDVTRVCGHRETEGISYQGSRHLQMAKAQGRTEFCRECHNKMKAWFDTPGTRRFEMALQPISGSEKQVAWAKGLREAHLIRLKSVMASAIDDGSETGLAMWRAIYGFLLQHQASFWIDQRSHDFGYYYFELEASYYLRGTYFGVVFARDSVFGQMHKRTPYLIKEIKALTPESLAARGQAMLC